MGFFCKSSSSTAPVFGFSSTAEQVTEGIDASDCTAIVTGASGGIGIETARVLALRGAQVVLAVRNVAAGEKTKESILKETSNSARLHVLELDLSSIQSVRNFCRNFLALNLPLNILVNNAGIMACPFALSVDGIESQFATNHVGHFLLTNLLLDKMKSTAKETGIQGRIVNVSSMGHKLFTYPGGIRFHTLNDESTYSRERAYGQSKLANILHAKELARRFEEEGVNLVANALHPGIIKTNLTRNSTSFRLIETIVVPFAGKSIPQVVFQLDRMDDCWWFAIQVAPRKRHVFEDVEVQHEVQVYQMNLLENEDSLSSSNGFLETDLGEINLFAMDDGAIVPIDDQDDEHQSSDNNASI